MPQNVEFSLNSSSIMQQNWEDQRKNMSTLTCGSKIYSNAPLAQLPKHIFATSATLVLHPLQYKEARADRLIQEQIASI